MRLPIQSRKNDITAPIGQGRSQHAGFRALKGVGHSISFFTLVCWVVIVVLSRLVSRGAGMSPGNTASVGGANSIYSPCVLVHGEG